MIPKEFPLNPVGCRLVQESLDTADFNVAQQIAILNHCQKCSTCQKYSQQLTNLRTLLMSQVRIQVPNDFDIKLRQKIAASKNAKTAPSWFMWVSQPAFGAVATVTVLGILVGTYYFKQPTVLVPQASQIEISNKANLAQSSDKEDVIAKIQNQSTKNSTIQPQAVIAPSQVVKETKETYVAVVSSNEIRNLPKRGRNLHQAPKQISLDEIDVEIRYGSASRTLPLSAVTYGSRPVLKVETVSTNESRSDIATEAKIF